MKKTLYILILIAAVGAALAYIELDTDDEISYRFVEVVKGDIEATVGATGTLAAVRTVEVGTQVSGQISQVYVDYNDRVEKGQRIAAIDPTLLEQAVRVADAEVERSRAELLLRDSEFARNLQLFERQVITESEFGLHEYNLAVAQANLKAAEISLERARQNLAYTYIDAPVNGVITERNVDVGQTVAATLSSPVLFLIAEDLSRMEILASVDESDIGFIEEGQEVRFTVQAHKEDVFHGVVRQVRLQPRLEDNVVNYTVVVEVDNSDQKLLPGMTATVDFLIDTATDVYTIPNSALRFRPTEAMINEVRARGTASDSPPETILNARPQDGSRGSTDVTRLWYLDNEGLTANLRVRTGLSDGQLTEIEASDLKPGMQIIAGVAVAEQQSDGVNPFNDATQYAGRGRRGGF